MSDEAAKKGLPVKTIVIVFALLVAEAGAVVAFMKFFGGPSPVQGLDLPPENDLDQIHEIEVLREKFTNDQTGRVWIWDAEVVVLVKKRHLETVQAELEAKRAQIRAGVQAIVARARPPYFKEPGYETLCRQMLELMRTDELFGEDAEGEPRVQRVLIPSMVGFPSDF